MKEKLQPHFIHFSKITIEHFLRRILFLHLIWIFDKLTENCLQEPLSICYLQLNMETLCLTVLYIDT